MASAPVVIVGGGPVGMVLAMNLAAFGVQSILANIEPSSRWHPKGNTHNARTMEHYRRLGIAGALRRLGLPPDHPTDVGYFTTLTGWEVARLPMPSERQKMAQLAGAAVTDQVPEPLFRANQMYVEAHLHRHIQTLPEIGLRYGWRCVEIAQEAGRFAVAIEEVATGRRERLDCDYVIGCDGGQSFVRRWLGFGYSGERPAEQVYGSGATVSTHVRAPGLSERLLRRPCWQYWTVNPNVRSNLVTLDGKGEFLFNTRIRSIAEPPDPHYIARVFQESVGEAVDVEFIAHWPWTAGQALVADRFGEGRVWLAGDAVHLFTPTGGFGMNTGVDDAANLAWKLAAMVQGWGGSGLLASYEAERKPIAVRNTGAARQLSKNIGDIAIPPELEDDSPAGERARREVGAVLPTCGEQYGSIGVQLGARYDGSPIVAENGAPPADNFIDYTPSSVPGGRAPHVWLDESRGWGSSLFDRLGAGFTLLRLGANPPDASAMTAAAARRNIPVKVLDVPGSDAHDLYSCDLALVRPDQHIAWRGNRVASDPDRLFAQLVGAVG